MLLFELGIESDSHSNQYTVDTYRKHFFQLQLLITLSFVFLIVYENNTRLFVQRSPVLLFVALFVVFASVIAMICCENVRRTAPTNFIMLTIFTVAETYLVGASTMRFQPDDVRLTFIK